MAWSAATLPGSNSSAAANKLIKSKSPVRDAPGIFLRIDVELLVDDGFLDAGGGVSTASSRAIAKAKGMAAPRASPVMMLPSMVSGRPV